jgi:hypothetical protein
MIRLMAIKIFFAFIIAYTHLHYKIALYGVVLCRAFLTQTLAPELTGIGF